jgi:hypothetical protein
MSILSRARVWVAIAGLTIVVAVAACSSAATVAPPATGAVATQATVTTPPPATSPTPAVSSTPNPTGNDLITAGPSGGALTAPPGTPMLVDPFTSAGIATTVDTAAHAVDPSTYRTTIPGTQYQAVYVVFALRSDAVGKVKMEMTLGDQDVLAEPLEIDYTSANSWGDFKVTFPSDGIPAGVYKAVMTFEPTGAQVIQYFAVN